MKRLRYRKRPVTLVVIGPDVCCKWNRPSALMCPLLAAELFGEYMDAFSLTPPVFLSYFCGLRRKHSSSEIGKCQPCQR
jgi:hypothetical protein